MNILLTLPGLHDQGGVSNYYNSLTSYLCQYHSITCFEVGSFNSKYNFSHPLVDQLRFIKELLFHNIDLVHINPSLNLKSFLRDGLFILWAKRKKIPVIVFYHGWDNNFYDKITGILYFFFNLTYKKADTFIVLASDFKSKLLHKRISQPIYLLTTAVSDDLIRNDLVEHRINEREVSSIANILFLSRLERDKGIYETIDAFNILVNQGKNIYLSIAGDGSLTSNIKKYINSLGLNDRIKMIGYVKGIDKQQTYLSHDIFCLPSYSEGMPIVVLEAMSFGLPVVTRPVGGIKDFFKNGEMGYISESKEPLEIANCIKKILDNHESYNSMSLYNYTYAKYNFMASKVARKLCDIYELSFGSNKI